MKKYVVRLNTYVRNVFIAPDQASKGMIWHSQVESIENAMTFRKKYLAEAIAKALGGKVEELK